ncbi:Putative pentatricopeptide repeat-containing protein At2g01510 [Linum grandiflorum]
MIPSPPCRAIPLKKLASLATSQFSRSHQRPPDARLIKTGFDPSISRFNFQVKELLNRGDLTQALRVFYQMPHTNTVTANLLISGYVKSGNLSVARQLFDDMVERTAVSWTILIGGYSLIGRPAEAFQLFVEMCRFGTEPDHVTFATLLSGFNGDGMVRSELDQLHGLVVKLGHESTAMVCNSLIDTYCKTGRMENALQLFDEMPQKDTVSFNALMTGCVRNGRNQEVVELFAEMQKSEIPLSDFTFAAVIGASVGLDNLAFGQQVHGLTMKNSFVLDMFVGNALLDFYSKHGCVCEASKLFCEMPELDGVSYNVLVTAFAWVGQFHKSIELFRELQRTTFDRMKFPYSTMLSIAANKLDLQMGQQLHSLSIVTGAVSDVLVANASVDMYAKCGKFEEAQRIFGKLGNRSTVPWTAMLSAYIQKRFYEEGLQLFKEMLKESTSPDQATFASVLKASASLASISLGKQLHCCAIRTGFLANVYCGSALVDMYAKCGSMKNAVQSFEEMPEKNVVSWNAVISAYAHDGDGVATIKSFENMVSSGYKPDSVSFLSVLSACSHSGLVEQGFKYFSSMTNVYKLVPKREHYASMVDLLCRRGKFKEAEKLMGEMPFEPDEILWSSVLNSCRIHKNRELANKASQKLFSMETLKDGAPYITMSNILAAAGQWDEVANVKKAMRERGVRKVPAYSWVEINHKFHVFSSNDKSHPKTREIIRKLDELEEKMQKEGYAPDTSCALQNVEQNIKVESLKYHSERLAIAFALLHSPQGRPILVMKNLRACADCHAAIKVISKIVGRKITVRDSSRFHRFKDGFCSCGDYW